VDLADEALQGVARGSGYDLGKMPLDKRRSKENV